MELGIYKCVAGLTTNANPYGAATTWVVWANSTGSTYRREIWHGNNIAPVNFTMPAHTLHILFYVRND